MAETLPQKRRPGRRTKLTPETHERIIKAVQAGATFNAAAGAAGIDERTLYRWLAEAEETDAPAWKRQFRQDLYRARDELEVRVVAGSVMKSAMGGYELERTTITKPDGTREQRVKFAPADGRVGLEVLARRFHDRGWGRNPVELSGPGGGAIQIQHAATIGELAERLAEELAAVEGIADADVLDETDDEV